ncbi:hypothetical protein FisN_16Lh323 [Fistulifera solaris]|uniref:Uncharacterized protein n=1 Tax=Fistulifera solaris TaxID=1519565 RepID=A0A1Z5KNT8_FISSO|nr:hypothetical protein FisN_16Lh323 [Fistulifera solaris]|eukprot:GAX27983.1 hypothetical protein FisN_16Lh323 [Fistulifera solaris]
MELTTINFSDYPDNHRPFTGISGGSEHTAMTGSPRRRKEAKCNSDPRIWIRSNHSLQSAGKVTKRSKSVQSSILPFYKRKSYTKCSHNASFVTNGDTTSGMDLIHAMRLSNHLGGIRDRKLESSLKLEALCIRNPETTRKNIFFFKPESVSRPTEDTILSTNSPSSTNVKVNPAWKEILHTKDIFRLDYPPCSQVEIDHDAQCVMSRSESCVTIDSMLVD